MHCAQLTEFYMQKAKNIYFSALFALSYPHFSDL